MVTLTSSEDLPLRLVYCYFMAQTSAMATKKIQNWPSRLTRPQSPFDEFGNAKTNVISTITNFVQSSRRFCSHKEWQVAFQAKNSQRADNFAFHTTNTFISSIHTPNLATTTWPSIISQRYTQDSLAPKRPFYSWRRQLATPVSPSKPVSFLHPITAVPPSSPSRTLTSK